MTGRSRREFLGVAGVVLVGALSFGCAIGFRPKEPVRRKRRRRRRRVSWFNNPTRQYLRRRRRERCRCERDHR